MIKTAPRPLQLALMVAFVLSCFCVLLYLWLQFGGTSPLQPKGYRFHVQFPEATQLAQQADVRISGVPVGQVVKIEQGQNNRTDATIEMEADAAPIPRDARAMLRQKTLLGETYVDLTPGNPRKGTLPENATLASSAVAPTVELDEIFRSFDAKTRAEFQTWMQSQSAALEGRGGDINAAFGNLPELAVRTEQLLRELNAQSDAVSRVIGSTGEVFDAISERDGQLRALVTESNRVFQVTAARDRELAALFRVLPRFERELTVTLPRLTAFANRAKPVVEQLQPAATEMGPTFEALRELSPEFKRFFRRLGPVITATERGVPSLERTMREIPPLLEDLRPLSRNLDPMARYLNLNRRDVTAFIANLVGATNAYHKDLPETDEFINYVRVAATLGPEGLTYYPRPLGNSRANAYPVPGVSDRLATGLPVYDTRRCSNGDPLPPASSDPPDLQPLVERFVFRTKGRDVARPGCTAQGPFPGFGTSFPRLRADP